MEIAGIIFVFVTISFIGTQAGPLHGHSHPHTVAANVEEEWNITAVLKSGMDDNPNWVITEADRKMSSNISVIARAIDWYTHNIGVGKKLKPTSGYKGFTISHVLNGKDTGTNHLPACTLPNLEKALIKHTAPPTMSEYHKHLILCTLDNCGKKVPATCYDRPTPKV